MSDENEGSLSEIVIADGETVGEEPGITDVLMYTQKMVSAGERKAKL